MAGGDHGKLELPGPAFRVLTPKWSRGIGPGDADYLDNFLPIVADAQACFGRVLVQIGEFGVLEVPADHRRLIIEVPIDPIRPAPGRAVRRRWSRP